MNKDEMPVVRKTVPIKLDCVHCGCELVHNFVSLNDVESLESYTRTLQQRLEKAEELIKRQIKLIDDYPNGEFGLEVYRDMQDFLKGGE